MKHEGLEVTRRNSTKDGKDLLAKEVLFISPLQYLVNPNPLVYKEDMGHQIFISLPQCRRLEKVCVCNLDVSYKRLGFVSQQLLKLMIMKNLVHDNVNSLFEYSAFVIMCSQIQIILDVQSLEPVTIKECWVPTCGIRAWGS